jgi:hypothetical protein
VFRVLFLRAISGQISLFQECYFSRDRGRHEKIMRLASATCSNEVRLWGLDSGIASPSLDWEAVLPSSVAEVMLTFDGSQLVCVLTDVIQSYRLEVPSSMKPVAWKVKKKPASSYTWQFMSKCDNHMLCAGLYSLAVLDAFTGIVLNCLRLSAEDVSIGCAVLSGDGARIVTSHRAAPNRSIICVRDSSGVSPTLALLASVVMDAGVRHLKCNTFARSIAFVKEVPDDWPLQPKLELWNSVDADVAANGTLASPLYLDACSTYAFSDEGSRIITVSSLLSNQFQLKVWECSSGSQLYGIMCEGVPHSFAVYDSIGIIVGYDSGKIEVFDQTLNFCILAWDAHVLNVISFMSCSPVGRNGFEGAVFAPAQPIVSGLGMD